MTDAATAPPPADVVYDEDFITVYRALDAALCRDIVERFDRDPAKWRGRIISHAGEVARQEQTKRSWDLEIRDEGAWREVFRSIHPRITDCVQHYLARSPVLQSFALQGTGYKIQMYSRHEGYFRWHADALGRNHGNRVVALILYLNDVLRGGETEFFHQGVKVCPRAGHLLLFPAGWNYMHCGHVPESGAKYIVQTFIRTRD
ncbi:2OG-Fe(II) oxygenase [Xylophilus sp.]|uniref:2OG-Fe(II) oxygenase n=1 Tax=Xylophilus sp. TaxID=2653893 RepID=UPI0013B887CB|nr:2OG-Fe(II) oxygenase [Xylophilus sp.]KAF1049159.1 MAG: hypothetical protein GAK38_00927 [Xylophilus sp.]